MSEKIRKELKVSAIENGTVIDHIPANQVFQVIRILELDCFENQVTFGTNLESKKFGKKGIIKVSNRFFEDYEIRKIAIAAPTASLIVIKDFLVTEKRDVQLPDTIDGIVKCFNPKCITNIENVPQRFSIIDKENLKLHCFYCEKTTKQDDIDFL